MYESPVGQAERFLHVQRQRVPAGGHAEVPRPKLLPSRLFRPADRLCGKLTVQPRPVLEWQ